MPKTSVAGIASQQNKSTREQYHAELDRQLDDEKKAVEEFLDSGRDGSGFKMA